MIEIPQFFIDEDHRSSNQTFVKVYQSNKELIKSQINLTGFLVNFILEGSKHLNHLEESVQLNASQLVLLKPSHCLMTEKLSQDRFYKSLLCFFSPTLLSKILVKYDLNQSNTTTNNRFFIIDSDDYLEHFVQSILFLKQSNAANNSDFFSLKIEELLLYLVHRYGTPIVDFLRSPNDSEMDLNFERIVESNINTKLTIEELAFLCHMSTSTFKRKFKQRHHASPAKWFQQKRLQKAKLLLTNHSNTPSQIYAEVGFENFSSFSQAFKKEFGQSPKQYQKNS